MRKRMFFQYFHFQKLYYYLYIQVRQTHAEIFTLPRYLMFSLHTEVILQPLSDSISHVSLVKENFTVSTALRVVLFVLPVLLFCSAIRS